MRHRRAGRRRIGEPGLRERNATGDGKRFQTPMRSHADFPFLLRCGIRTIDECDSGKDKFQIPDAKDKPWVTPMST
jgi:hypothetical protein